MSSLSVGRGLEDLEHWLGSFFFTAAELAAAELLLRLSGDDAAGASTSSSLCQDLGVDEEDERFVEGLAISTELDRRARKRYRLLSDLYTTSAAAATKKRKTCAGGESELSLSVTASEATR
jgi:hypothetical protein